MSMESSVEGLWYYAGSEDAEAWSGGFAERDQAVAEGQSEFEGGTFFVVKASNPPVRIADWIGAEDAITHAEDSILDSDRCCSEHDEGVFACVTPEQEKDLAERIRKACDEWQEAHGLVFKTYTFASMSAPEPIPALEDLVDD